MFKCNDCDCVFECPDGIEEKVGEYCGQPAYEMQDVCPNCGSHDIDEAIQCDVCGEWFSCDEMEGSVCENCLYEYRYRFHDCKNICGDCKSPVMINDLAVSLLTEDAINEILIKELERANVFSPIDCKEFIDSDKEWFGEKIKEMKS